MRSCGRGHAALLNVTPRLETIALSPLSSLLLRCVRNFGGNGTPGPLDKLGSTAPATRLSSRREVAGNDANKEVEVGTSAACAEEEGDDEDEHEMRRGEGERFGFVFEAEGEEEAIAIAALGAAMTAARGEGTSPRPPVLRCALRAALRCAFRWALSAE